MPRISSGLSVVAVLVIPAVTTACGVSRSKTAELPPPVHPPDDEHRLVKHGHELFYKYCASCHGVTAEGNGPLVGELRHAPADLTRIAARRDGVFPEHEIHEIIDGRRRVRSHGPGNMPVWGRRFTSAYAGGTSDSGELAFGQTSAT